MITEKTKCNLFFILLVLYYLQGFLYTSGSIISQAILVCIFMISIYYAYKVNREIDIPPFFKGINIFLLLITIYGIFYIIEGPKYTSIFYNNKTNPIDFIKNPLISFLPIYTFFYFAQKGIIDIKWLQRATYAVIAVAVTMYFTNMERLIIERGFDLNDGITNNIGYNFLMIIPLLMAFNNKKIIQFSLMGIIFFFVISAMKRGAIIIATICLLYFFWKNFKISSYKERAFLIILTFIAIYVGIAFIQHMSETNTYFNSRIMDTLAGKSSNRDIIYTKLLDHFTNKTSIITMIFGSGADYTIEITGTCAHNDWLELAIDCGIVGLVIYVYYFYSLYKSILQVPVSSVSKGMIWICFIILLLRSFISMSYSDLFFPMSLAIAYSLSTKSGRLQHKSNLI